LHYNLVARLHLGEDVTLVCLLEVLELVNVGSNAHVLPDVIHFVERSALGNTLFLCVQVEFLNRLLSESLAQSSVRYWSQQVLHLYLLSLFSPRSAGYSAGCPRHTATIPGHRHSILYVARLLRHALAVAIFGASSVEATWRFTTHTSWRDSIAASKLRRCLVAVEYRNA